MMKDEHKVIIFSILAILFIWAMDAVIDAFIFHQGTFLDLFLLDMSLPRLYLRSLFIVCFTVFAFLITTILKKNKRAEKALRESEKRYRMLFETAGDAIFILNAEGEDAGRIVTANRSAADMHGYTIAELLTLSITDLDVPEHAEKVPGRIKRILQGELVKEEITHHRKDGSVFPVEMSAGLLEIDNHKYILAFDRDISRRRQAEEKLKLLSTVVEEAPDGVQITDLKGYIMFSNRATEEIYGYAADEFRRMHANDLNADPAFASDLIIPHIHKTGKWVGEIMVKHKDGRTFPILLNTSIVHDDTGNPIAMVGIIRDITENKRKEEELQKSERFLSTIFDSIRDPFCIFDRHFRIIKVNEAYASMKNRSVGKVIGEKCYSVFEQRNHICDTCVVDKTFKRGEPCTKEKHISRHDSTDMWVEIYTYPVMNQEGRVTHVIEYTRDITDRKKSEEDKKHLIEELEYLARTDSLTGLLNRRALMKRLEYEIDRAKRYGSELSLVLCDIDNFKEINDTYGHNAGDRALRIASEVLCESLRKTDILGRYGGDEFIMILPETSLYGAENLAEKIRFTIENADFQFIESQPARMSLSFGVTSFSATDDIDSMVKRSDNALYRSKQAGRNKVNSIGP
jgi:diguanylate cyclase (GGDEF)-like protein/PAS domain S-box-containing protein